MKIQLQTGSLSLKIHQEDIPLGELLCFAARNNKKRGFLFLSKVLGKHWPVKPSVMQNTHRKLAQKLVNCNIETAPYFVGMAETATALGRGVFEEFCALTTTDALYSHTTRYRLHDKELIPFNEEHSHAVGQWLHLPCDPKAHEIMQKAKDLVLIDDEMSTGKTFVNLVHALKDHMPQLSRVYLITLIDMVDSHALHTLNKSIPFELNTISLLKGSFTFEPNAYIPSSPVISTGNPDTTHKGLPTQSGRVGVFSGQWNCFQDAHGIVSEHAKYDVWEPLLSSSKQFLSRQYTGKTLVLGSGEFMYEPFRLALSLENQGCDVYFQATTRSPILPGPNVESTICFKDNYGECIDNFVYNVCREMYQDIIICYETASLPKEHDLPKKLNAKCYYWREK